MLLVTVLRWRRRSGGLAVFPARSRASLGDWACWRWCWRRSASMASCPMRSGRALERLAFAWRWVQPRRAFSHDAATNHAPVAVGALIGLVAATVMSRMLSSVLFGISPSDPIALGGAALLVLVVALAAGLIAATPCDPRRSDLRLALRVSAKTALIGEWTWQPGPRSPSSVPAQLAVFRWNARACWCARHADRSGRARRCLERDGLVLDSVNFHETIRVAASTEVSAARDADLVLFSVKSMDTERTAQQLASHVRADVLVVDLQNGVENVAR